jgi:quercetin dioxygenase-like cupin family protein
MCPASMPSAKPAHSESPVVDSNTLARSEVWGETDRAVRWQGAFAVYGGHGTTASSTIVYEIEPGARLGWHTDATEETQYVIAGTGKLYLEDGSTHAVGPGSIFVLPTPMRHDLENTGKETCRAGAVLAAAMFTQDFDQVMLPPKSHILGTPNRDG